MLKENCRYTKTKGGREYILYLGDFLDEKIVAERNLLSRNAAGSNRILRIAEALGNCGNNVFIFSPAISLRAKWTGRVVHRQVIRKNKKNVTCFSRVLGVPILGKISSAVFFCLTLWYLHSRLRVSAIIVYNFSPLLVIATLISKVLWRVPIIHNIEDVSVPKLRDWKKNSDTNPVQQLVFSGCMQLIARISAKIIIPTQRFLPFLPKNKDTLVVSGCMDIKAKRNPAITKERDHDRIKLLFSGKISFEHGIQYLFEALTILETKEICQNKVEVDICGFTTIQGWLEEKIKPFENIAIKYHGFIEDKKYKTLLARADVCVALQDPKGRYLLYKTPSKVYEYLCGGKIVIATDVGDLALLPQDIIHICSPLNGENLATILHSLIENTEELESAGERAFEYAKNNFDYGVVGKRLGNFIFGEKVK